MGKSIQGVGAPGWIRKNAVREALNAVSEAARQSKSQTIIPLKMRTSDAISVKQATSTVAKLKEMDFHVYCRLHADKDNGLGDPFYEYCVKWGKDSAQAPEGFHPVE